MDKSIGLMETFRYTKKKKVVLLFSIVLTSLNGARFLYAIASK